MDKNVGSVNLDELKAAREALNRERGIETDPNMYSNYDPEKHKAEREQEKLARTQALDAETGDVSAEENSSYNTVQSEPEQEIIEQDAETILEEPVTEEIMPEQFSSENETTQKTASQSSSLKGIFEQEDSIDASENENIENFSDSNSEEIIVPTETNDTEPMQESVANEVIQNQNFGTLENDYARSPEVEQQVQEDDTTPNFDVYDNFADFEINSEVEAKPSNVIQPTTDQITLKEETVEEVSETEEDTSLDAFLSELDAILEKEEDDAEISIDDEIETNDSIESISESEEIASKEIVDEIQNGASSEIPVDISTASEEIINEEQHQEIGVDENQLNINENDFETINSQEQDESEIIVPQIDEKQQAEVEKINIQTNDDDPFSRLEKFAISENEPREENLETEKIETDVLDDFGKLNEISEETEKVEIAPSEEIQTSESDKTEQFVEEHGDVEEIEVGRYKTIEDFNFIDVISSNDFKKTDNMSYVLGKNSDGDIVYGNLRDTCGTAVFTRNEDVVYDGFSSILLSLLLKNTPEDIQFVVCDAMFDSDFDVFKNSSYMYFNRVAKNNREIVDSLVELSKELENRYNSLVYSGVKSISAYNLQAEERGTSKMPYIVLFLNNYTKMTQFLDADRINTCLHNILKFGRIVGVYGIIASTNEIERSDINLNLPTRICYKTENAHDSISAIGREGAENLKDERDFLYSTVYDEEVQHLKVPSLSRKEIELIIENLEK